MDELIGIEQAAVALVNGSTNPVEYAQALLMVENSTGLTKKDVIIERLKNYHGIVVTDQNFEELKKTKTAINKVKTNAEEFRKNVKKEFLKQQQAYWDGITEIKDEAESIVKELGAGIDVFETQKKEKQKEELIKSYIQPKLDSLIESGELDTKRAEMFEFSDRWMNASAVTKIGAPTKATQDEINNEVSRIMLIYSQYKSDVSQISNALTMTLINAHETKETLGIAEDTYISLLDAGVNVPDILQRMVADVKRIKEASEAKAQQASEKAAQEVKTQVQEQQQAKQEEATEGEKLAKNQIQIVDKYGELIAVARPGGIKYKVYETPDKFKGKTFEYTYTFSGGFESIKTFSTLLKVVNEMYPDFKYEEGLK